MSEYPQDQSYILTRLTLISSTGQAVQLRPIMSELNIYEDMYSSTLSGNVLVDDSLDLLKALPMSGFEYLDISFQKTQSASLSLSRIFRVYKTDAINVDLPRVAHQSYLIRFCSEEQFLSENKLVSFSYKDKLISDIVTSILKNDLKVSRPIDVDPTIGLTSYIIPAKQPFDAISFLASQAVGLASNANMPGFFFYENKNGFNFKSPKTIFSQTPILNYYYGPQNMKQNNTAPASADQTRVIKFTPLDKFNSLHASAKGMFGGSLYTVDFVRQKLTTIPFDYSAQFGASPHLDSSAGMFMPTLQDRFSKTPNQYSDAIRKLYYTTLDHDTDPIITKYQPNIRTNKVEQWLMQRNSLMEQLNYNRIQLGVVGDSRVTAGSVVSFTHPEVSSYSYQKQNPYYSGNYLITAVRHKINIFTYEMMLDAVKDSLATAYPAALSGDPTIKGLVAA